MNAGRRQRQEAGGFAARLREILHSDGSASSLAKAIARSEGAVRKWLRGESEPNVTDLRALCQATRTRVEWLVTGEGPRQLQAESAAPSAAKEALLDLPLLEAVISVTDEQLRSAGLHLSPAKRAALIAAGYDHARGHEAVDTEAIARLVRLAG